MGRKNTIHKAIGLTSVLLIFSAITFGCYNRDVAPVADNTYGGNIQPAPLTPEQIRQFSRTVRKVDGEARAHYKMALYFQERHRDRLAIDELRQVLKRDPSNAKACNAIGVSYDNLGDCSTAIAYYKQALQIDPGLDYVYNNLGYSLLLKKDMAGAVDAFQQAIALNGKEKRYHNNLGLAYAKQEKYDLAYAQFKEQNSEADADKLLAKVMRDTGKGGEVDAVLLAVKNPPAPEARKEVLAEAKPEATKVERIETKLVVPEVAVAESSPVTSEEEVIAKKDESPEMVVAEAKPEAPRAVEAEPAPLKQPEVVEIAAVQPLNTDLESNKKVIEKKTEPSEIIVAEAKPEVPEAAESAAVPLPFKTSENASSEAASVQVHDIRILTASPSLAAAGKSSDRKKADKEIQIVVENGNGVKGAAGKVAEQLRRKGFKVIKVADAKSFDHYSTKVFFYAGNIEEVRRMLKVIPNRPEHAELYRVGNAESPVRLLIGKDVKKDNASPSRNAKPEILKADSGGTNKPVPSKKKKA